MLVFLLISGIKDRSQGLLLKKMFQADYFRIVVCEDEDTVELCGALKVHLLFNHFPSSLLGFVSIL